MQNNKKSYNIKTFIIGDYKAGKTSIVRRFCDDEYINDELILMNDYSIRKFKTITINEHLCKLQIFDCPRGCERFGKIYYYNLYAHSFIFVYDITNIESFENIKNLWFEQYQLPRGRNLKEKYIIYNEPDKYEEVLLLLGTKSDLRNITNIDTCVPTEKAREYAHSINALFFEISSKDNININESILQFLIQIKNNYEKAKGKTKEEIDLESKSENKCNIN